VTGTGGPIWLVRHGSTEWTGTRWCGRSDPELTTEGRSAVERLASDLSVELATATDAGPTAEVAILASPLRRALETADAIARVTGGRVRVEPDLVEVDFGRVDGLTWPEIVDQYRDLSARILAGKDVDWPAGETAGAVARRAQTLAARIVGLAATVPLVVVGHGRLLGEIARHLPLVEPAWDRAFEPATARRLDLVDGRWVATRRPAPVPAE
jgi:probable phosphoglycerate mutase